MNYKETLFFVAKCLTITLEKENRKEIETQLKSTEIDWDAVVKLSTEHYVFPALYCNLKRADFLKHLPEELVNYMIYITDLNRERNLQIIEQAKEVNELLLDNNITPIFLKGTGNLLEGLYEDVAERMVGDIDFIVSKDDYLKTIKNLKNDKYTEFLKNKHPFPHTRHYARIVKENGIAALEIHDELITEKYFKYFGYDYISKSVMTNCNNENFISYKNQLRLTIISKHINDSGYLFKNISLRNTYDLFLLSKKNDAKNTVMEIKKISHYLNTYLASSYEVMGSPYTLTYNRNKQTEKYLKIFYKNLKDKPDTRIKYLNKYLFLKLRFNVVKKVLIKKEMRDWFFELISNKNWQQEKLSQLGLKKTKS
ncbi:nucleotidyltransferase family protein [Polaribacter sp. PL03]|uniref:nucleotidyltransferase family protein n=1 Tax=Polaribacter sp. PL03 TaxID=3088353 RepID=UPI0029CE8A9E|nr:nucleotidyltransferase family protein [Polaribacter sp. PL03]MDX6746694.1 nucleotidyltransferase family protein [Polaribacter sp. PL03]